MDDERQIQASLRLRLSKHEVVCCSHAREALETVLPTVDSASSISICRKWTASTSSKTRSGPTGFGYVVLSAFDSSENLTALSDLTFSILSANHSPNARSSKPYNPAWIAGPVQRHEHALGQQANVIHQDLDSPAGREIESSPGNGARCAFADSQSLTTIQALIPGLFP